VALPLKEKLDAAFGGWVAAAAVGGLLLHAMGFLSLRFYLAALGVRADLSLLDSRYLFEGANCVIFLLAALVNLLLLVLVGWLVLFLASRLVPRPARQRLREVARSRWTRLRTRYVTSSSLALLGIVFAVVAVQFVMRQCFQVQDLFFRGAPPAPAWLKDLVLAPEDGSRGAFFMGLLAAVGLTACLWLAAVRLRGAARVPWAGVGLLTLLLGLEVALLPINYGVLTAGRTMPRVLHVGDDRALAGRQAWLVWEDRDALTLLVVSLPVGGVPPERALVTVPRREAGRVETAEAGSVLQRLAGAGP
jgi:hypothetical protein